MNTHEDRAREFLLHMVEAVNKILLYTELVDRHSFWENGMLQDAVIRNIAIIGEAANYKIPLLNLRWAILNSRSLTFMA